MRLIACFIMSNRQVFFSVKKEKVLLEVKKIYPMRYSKKDIPEDPAYSTGGRPIFKSE